MSDHSDPRPNDGFAELVPWADPYIAALIEKLRRAADVNGRDSALIDELSAPPGPQDVEHQDVWPGDWQSRDWPDP
jgi:hypothetical protein